MTRRAPRSAGEPNPARIRAILDLVGASGLVEGDRPERRSPQRAAASEQFVYVERVPSGDLGEAKVEAPQFRRAGAAGSPKVAQAAPMAGSAVMFQPFASQVDTSFWQRFRQLKLNEWRLEDSAVPVWGYFSPNGTAQSSRFSLDAAAFRGAAADGGPPGDEGGKVWASGELLNLNTVEEFKALDKASFLDAHGAAILRAIDGGDATQDPSLLLRFACISFADLKKHKYIYWFGFPALLPPRGEQHTCAGCPTRVKDAIGDDALHSLAAACSRLGPGAPPLAFVVSDFEARPVALTLADAEASGLLAPGGAPTALAGAAVVVLDPGTSADHPGWPLRNVLALLSRRYGARDATVVCLRGGHACGAGAEQWRRALGGSLLLRARLAPMGGAAVRVGGWEHNARGRSGPRLSDLGAVMDPQRLSAASADLNLRLMRWRQYPGLDVERLGQLRVLLLGAGTLGCAVARLLVGWGVRRITFLDCGRVTYSNPTRQSLFETMDAAGGDDGNGKFKATAAAEALRRVLPAVDARGVVASIPMPGHVAAGEEDRGRCEAEAAALAEQMGAHDLVFLLTDTRESRWLPTLLAAAEDTPLVNVALGMDSFLVMRHGAGAAAPEGPRARLGCYFCTDVVAASNSLRDRTLDQMCTVTRPGLAPMAAAAAVELTVALLQHPLGHHAPAAPSPVVASPGSLPLGAMGGGAEHWASCLGALPHQIRLFLSSFSVMTPRVDAFDCCTACSRTVVEAYRAGGAAWVAEVCQRPKLLEDVSGVAKLWQEADAMNLDWDLDESDGDGEGGAEGGAEGEAEGDGGGDGGAAEDAPGAAGAPQAEEEEDGGGSGEAEGAQAPDDAERGRPAGEGPGRLDA